MIGAIVRGRYIFFLHWHWRVPDRMLKDYECVNFHMTDLPYGRGGSPLQNLILLGRKETVITAHRMTDEIDAGPVYLKRRLSLDGPAWRIYERAEHICREMIEEIVRSKPQPVPQEGEPTYFERRTPEQSDLSLCPASQLYDFIRMLDAPDYPQAYLDFGPWRLEFSDADEGGEFGEVTAKVRFKWKPS